LRKGAGEHVLHCDGSLKVLAIPRDGAKILSCKIQSTKAAFVLYICHVNRQRQAMSKLCVEPLWADKCDCQAAEFMLHIYFQGFESALI
jgi:hypothetical protein